LAGLLQESLHLRVLVFDGVTVREEKNEKARNDGGTMGFIFSVTPHVPPLTENSVEGRVYHNLMRIHLMRNLWRASLTLAVVALIAAPALAQRPGGGGRGFGGGNLLTNKSVQEELKLDDAQKKKVEEVSKKIRELMTEKTKGIAREDLREKMPAIMKEINAESTKLLADCLKPEQTKRYKQIQLQQQGTRAFSSEEVQTALKLTTEQKDGIKKIGEDARKAIEEQTKDLERTDFQKRTEIRNKVNKESEGKIAATLTSEQKKTWTEMVGEKFEVKFERPTRPGGGGRPGAGGGARPGARPDF
jgi:Spy/CpxP family protein refolding chaperone